MSCSRPECENIMCDTYIGGIGYVCYECKNEFEKYMEEKYPDESEFGEHGITTELTEFFNTPKGHTHQLIMVRG